MSLPPIKSTVTVSNEQRPVVVVSNSIQSTRTVVESVPGSTDHSGNYFLFWKIFFLNFY